MNISRGAFTSNLIRGQGVNIFWGGLSLFFAAAAVYYYWQYVENEQTARVLRDQEIMILRENTQLRAQVDKLQENLDQIDELIQNRNQEMREQAKNMAEAIDRVERAEKERSQLVDLHAKRVEAEKRIREALAKVKDIDVVEMVERNDEPVLRIENAALFEPGTMKLTPKALRTLQRIAQSVVDELDVNEIVIESFTDSDPVTGTMAEKYASNYDLAAARASVVGRFLIDRGGLPADRVLIASRGPNFPIMPNTTPELKAQNRRIEILLRPGPRMMRTVVQPAKPPSPPAEPVEPEVIEVDAVESTP